jgi:hypothetical protein
LFVRGERNCKGIDSNGTTAGASSRFRRWSRL